MMKLFNYLECDNVEAISDKIYAYLQDHTTILDEPMNRNWRPLSLDILDQVPELAEFFSNLNLEPNVIHVLRTCETRNLHVDYNPEPRIMFPVRNTVGTAVTNFYDLTDFIKIPVHVEHYVYYKIFFTSQKLIGSYTLDRPVVFNPNVPHQVVHDVVVTTPRIALTIGFKNPPTELLLGD